MKTYLIYGFLLAFTGFLLRLVLFICGLEGDPAHHLVTGLVSGTAGLAIGITFLVLGIRARRSSVPADQAFAYGQACGAGAAIQAIAAVFSAILTYLYLTLINPNFVEMMAAAQRERMEARGMSGEQLEKAMHWSGIFSGPGAMAIYALLGSMFMGMIIVLIAAAFLRRPSAHDPLPA